MTAFEYKKPFRIILASAILVILVGCGSLVAYLVRYSATSDRVCQRCHPEITALWEKSNGHPADQTKCFACHSQAHRILPANLNLLRHLRDNLVPPEYLADDQQTSQRCLDCHQDVLEADFQPKKKTIKINHRYHQAECLSCTDCHRTAGHEYLTDGSNRPTVEECLHCHLKEFEGPPKSLKCLNCHDVLLAPGRTWQDEKHAGK
jgi:hypothetical protein